MSGEKVKLKEIDWEKYSHLIYREWCKDIHSRSGQYL